MSNWRPPQHIRATVQALVRKGSRLLVFELHDSLKDEVFYRPIGGGIEFQERAADAVLREFKEETGFDAFDPRFVGSLENIYVYEGVKGHEIVCVYECKLRDAALYDRDSFEVRDGDEPVRHAAWVEIERLTSDSVRFYPDGIKTLARQLAASHRSI